VRIRYEEDEDEEDDGMIVKPPILEEPIYHPRRTILQARA
jgi:hypothetical protein